MSSQNFECVQTVCILLDISCGITPKDKTTTWFVHGSNPSRCFTTRFFSDNVPSSFGNMFGASVEFRQGTENGKCGRSIIANALTASITTKPLTNPEGFVEFFRDCQILSGGGHIRTVSMVTIVEVGEPKIGVTPRLPNTFRDGILGIFKGPSFSHAEPWFQ